MSEQTPNIPKEAYRAAKECAGFSIRRASRALTHVYDKHLSASGIKGTQFSLLNAVALAGQPTIKWLAELMLMDRTTLSRNLKPLEKSGLLRVVSNERDRREKGLVLTPRGRKLLTRALPYWAQAQAEVVALIGEARLQRLRADLKQLEKLATSS